VFDCFGGTLLDYFRQTTAITAEPPDKPSRTIQQIVQDIADNKDRRYNIRVLSKRLLRISKNITAESRYKFSAFLKEDIADFARSLEGKLEKNWVGTIQMLQSDQFFNLCESYERPTRVFMIADSAEDIVETEVLFRARDGSSLKPEDYLQRFERFVLENPDHVEAIEILLNKPREFSTKELERLRRVLAERPDDLRDKFTERNLRRAYHNELADIISIIRHAARGEPLLTAEGRVDRALEKLRASRKFTREQEDWLTLIRRHLIDNLILEKEDFDIMPIFKRQGVTFQRLNEVFDGRLEELLLEINEAVLS
jgi:type I restriction enzyme R subunit